MTKFKIHSLHPYMAWVCVLVIVLAVGSYEISNWGAAAALAIVGLGTIIALFEGQPTKERSMVAISGIALVAASMLGGFQFALTFLAIETLLVLGLAVEALSFRMVFVLFTSAFIFASSFGGELASYFWSVFFCLRLLVVPSNEETANGRMITFFFGALAVLVAIYSSKFAIAPEAGIALGICAILNVFLGRATPSFVAATLSLVVIEPKTFFLIAPIVLLSFGGLWAMRLATVLCAITGVFVLLQGLHPGSIAVAALAGVSSGFCCWLPQPKRLSWAAIGGFVAAMGAGILFNQELLMNTNMISTPEELAPLATFTVCVGLGFWLRKFYPVKVRLKRPKVPEVRFHVPKFPTMPRLEFLDTVLVHQDFSTILLLVGATIAIWFVRLWI